MGATKSQTLNKVTQSDHPLTAIASQSKCPVSMKPKVNSGSVAPVRHREKLTLAPQSAAAGAADCRGSASGIRGRRGWRLAVSARP